MSRACAVGALGVGLWVGASGCAGDRMAVRSRPGTPAPVVARTGRAPIGAERYFPGLVRSPEAAGATLASRGSAAPRGDEMRGFAPSARPETVAEPEPSELPIALAVEVHPDDATGPADGAIAAAARDDEARRVEAVDIVEPEPIGDLVEAAADPGEAAEEMPGLIEPTAPTADPLAGRPRMPLVRPIGSDAPTPPQPAPTPKRRWRPRLFERWRGRSA